MLLNTLQYLRLFSTTKNYPVQNANSVEVKKLNFSLQLASHAVLER